MSDCPGVDRCDLPGVSEREHRGLPQGAYQGSFQDSQ